MGIQDDARQIMRALHHAHGALKSRFVREWVPQRLTVTQFHALEHLNWYARPEGMTIGGLVEYLGLAYSTVSSLVDRLESQGWVERVRNPEDRRCIHILMTKKAKALFQDGLEQTHRFVGETIGRLSPEERKGLIQALNRLIMVMESPHWPEYDSFHPSLDDSEQQRFRRALDGWVEAKLGIVGQLQLLARLAEEDHLYEISGYLKQASHDQLEQLALLSHYGKEQVDLSTMLQALQTQHSMARDAGLDAWRIAESLDDPKFRELVERAGRDAHKHKHWFRRILDQLKEGATS